MKLFRLTVIFLLPVTLGVPLLFPKPSTSSKAPSYDSGFNAALNLTLEVGSDFKAQRKNYTWADLQAEVCRRANVTRKEPWKK